MSKDNICVSKSLLRKGNLDKDFLFLMDLYFYEYNQVKFRYTNGLRNKKFEGLKRSEIKSLCDPYGYLPYRVFKSIESEVKGLIKSQGTHRKNNLEKTKDKIELIEKELKKLREKYNNLKKNQSSKLAIAQTSFKQQYKNLNRSIVKKSEKLQRLQSTESILLKEVKDKAISICYGTKKKLKQRKLIHVKDQQKINHWKSEWNFNRYKEMYFTGSSDELMGNDNAHIIYENNQYFLNLVYPNGMMNHPKIKDYFSKHNKETSKRWVFKLPIEVKTNEVYLQEHILSHKTLKKEQKVDIPLGVRLMKRKDGSMELHCSIHPIEQIKLTNKNFGTIGVDINPDNLAWTEVNEQGNFIKANTIPLPLNNKTSGQRENLISHAIDKIIQHALYTNKSIVLENLDFTKKKKELIKNRNKDYARMLSAFSYQKTLDLFKTKALKHQVELISVDPAYTSKIGELKYQFRHKLEIHESAAMVIARRGMNFKERLPKQVGKFVLKSNKEKQYFEIKLFKPVEEKQLSIHKYFKSIVKHYDSKQQDGDVSIELPTQRLRHHNYCLQDLVEGKSFPLKYSVFPLEF